MTPQNVFKQVWNFLTKLKVAAVLIVILLLLAALGSCFPQTSVSLDADAAQSARWETGVRARYGSLASALVAVGAFRWFRAPVFLASLALLSVATLVCTLDRWRIVWRRAFRPQAVATDTTFDAAPHKSQLTGLQAAELPHMVRKSLEERGFCVRSQAVEDFMYLRGDRNRLAALATLVTHLAVLFLLLGTLLSSGFGWREELTIEPDGTAEVQHRSQLAVQNKGFDIGRYPDGSAAAYQAQVIIVEGGQAAMRGSVGVNQPLRHGGVGFYLRGYGEQERGYSLTLVAVHDPGYGLFVAAGFLLLSGLTVSFNFPRSWIQARTEPDGTLRLAGWAERRACDFGRQFTRLVEEMGGWEMGRLEDAGERKVLENDPQQE
jgi:cytochrome c biogenesis protein